MRSTGRLSQRAAQAVDGLQQPAAVLELVAS